MGLSCKKGQLARHEVSDNDLIQASLMCMHNENVCMGVFVCVSETDLLKLYSETD